MSLAHYLAGWRKGVVVGQLTLRIGIAMAIACVSQAVPARAEPVMGSESGTVYNPVYTCASGHLTVRYSPPPMDQRVFFGVDFSDDDGVGWSWLFNFNRPDGSAGAAAVWASPPITSWTIAEGLTEKGPRSLVSAWGRVAALPETRQRCDEPPTRGLRPN